MSPEDQLARKAPVSICPVPSEQQPLNEFKDLQESWFFSWGTDEIQHYIRKIVWCWCWCWLLAGPIAASSFPLKKYPAQFILVGTAGAFILPILALIYLYVGWRHVSERLLSTTVFYEESGWYDGQSWIKPLEVIAQDRLVVTHQVKPVLQRIQKTLWVIALILLAEMGVWQFFS